MQHEVMAENWFVDWQYHDPGWVRIGLAIAMLVVTVAIAGRRVAWLVKLIRSGKSDTTRLEGIEERAKGQLVEVFGQKKLLKWNAPGIAHFLTFWGFLVLGLTIVEAYGALIISRDFAFPIIGRARWLGALEDFFGVMVLVGIVYFAINRLRNAPERRSATAASTARTTGRRGWSSA